LSKAAGKLQKNFLYRNLANATSILGVLPVMLRFLDDGYRYLVPLIIFNNMMDDLDGVLAAKLNIRSQYGADLDNICDAVAHVALALAVGRISAAWCSYSVRSPADQSSFGWLPG